MRLEEVLKDVEIIKVFKGGKEENLNNIKDIEVEDIADNSKVVTDGTLFIAENGYKHNGHEYIKEAITNGSKVIVLEDEKYIGNTDEIYILTKDSRKEKAKIAINFYQNPAKDMKIIGVTGTKGKTTVTFMLRYILEEAGFKTGLIGTIYTAIQNKVLSANNLNTTPDSIELQKLLSLMKKEGVDYVVMEVSSQALKMHRVDGIDFDIAVFTNIYKEHISKSEHKDMKEYLNEKLKLFKMAKKGIINADDFAKDYFQKEVKNSKMFGLANSADYIGYDINIRSTEVNFRVKLTDKLERIVLKIPGRYSVYNALAAIAVCKELNIPDEKIISGLSKVVIPGRFEVIENKENIPVIIDFATLPESLENVLKSARLYVTGRVVIVLGGEGEKNIEIRKKIGNTVGKYASNVILTTGNPRSEDFTTLTQEIASGIKQVQGKYKIIEDREEAIIYALKKAQKRDMIILAGLGHNAFIEKNGQKIPVDEKKIVTQYFENKK